MQLSRHHCRKQISFNVSRQGDSALGERSGYVEARLGIVQHGVRLSVPIVMLNLQTKDIFLPEETIS